LFFPAPILYHLSHSPKKPRPQQKHANRIDVPDPETKPQPKRKKKSIKYKIETEAKKQIKQIKDYGKFPLKAETNLSYVGSRFTSCGREFHAL
jgi:adenine specific DNA methylase Mod